MSRFVKRVSKEKMNDILLKINNDPDISWYVKDLKQELIASWVLVFLFAIVIIVLH